MSAQKALQESETDTCCLEELKQAFFNTTWEVWRGQVLPDIEFFLEFLVFLLSFRENTSFIHKNLKILTISSQIFLFLKIFVNKDCIKRATPFENFEF